jgi:hypothetical protein
MEFSISLKKSARTVPKLRQLAACAVPQDASLEGAPAKAVADIESSELPPSLFKYLADRPALS